MTPYYLVCKKCEHTIQADAREDLTAKPRRCPVCDSPEWELIDGPLFPCKNHEREIIYKKILFVLRWCAENDQPCRTHPGCCPLAAHHCTDTTSIPGAVYDWIMSTTLPQEEE